jgi:hypothetical protein
MVLLLVVFVVATVAAYRLGPSRRLVITVACVAGALFVLQTVVLFVDFLRTALFWPMGVSVSVAVGLALGLALGRVLYVRRAGRVR